MGDDISMDSARRNGENRDDRSRIDPIEWSMHFWNLLVNYYGMSEIVGQLLFEQYTNEQPLAILPK